MMMMMMRGSVEQTPPSGGRAGEPSTQPAWGNPGQDRTLSFIRTSLHELIHVIPSHCKTGKCFFHQTRHPIHAPRHGAAAAAASKASVPFGPLVPSPAGGPALPPRKSGVVSFDAMYVLLPRV